ncbi:DUF3999 family protein [Spongiivirga citrea]|uniref:DUF3999 family protein n=1 Tax=Spongiivirga citrea TaxID=1481457 RepID=A0A6M0CSN9_9FLAO|nr:DUF3999 family protein [Spongiivirga citrea]NER19104.1 DUF3999 family protein [Spongiivirga citrea]
MNLKNKIAVFLFAGISFSAYAQIKTFDYQRELKNVTEDWHKISLTPELFSQLKGNLNGIRIFGVTKDGDTIEAPYILKVLKGKRVDKTIDFKRLNTSFNANGHYFSFKVPTEDAINQIALDFSNENFDWKLDLEGSQDQKEWFTVADDYRILSIKNQRTDYTFSTLHFPVSNYTYYRLLVKTKDKPVLNSASLVLDEITDASRSSCDIKATDFSQNKDTKQSIINLELTHAVPISQLTFKVNETFDYYRPMKIEYLKDSTETEKGWRYFYQTLGQTTLSSVEDISFGFRSTITNKIRITVENGSNVPLTFNDFKVTGYDHELVARFTTPASYFLAYGNEKAYAPRYDITSFTNKIPTQLNALTLGDEILIKKDATSTSPLFENKLWMWALMILIIAVMGWFTFKMLGKNSRQSSV